MIIQLQKPIQAHGNQRSQIELREPNGADIAACGFPFRIINAEDGSSQALPEAAAITALIARLGDIPRGSAGQLAVGDWISCMNAVFGFFGQSVPELSNAASTSPGSGNGIQSSP